MVSPLIVALEEVRSFVIIGFSAKTVISSPAMTVVESWKSMVVVKSALTITLV